MEGVGVWSVGFRVSGLGCACAAAHAQAAFDESSALAFEESSSDGEYSVNEETTPTRQRVRLD